MSKLTGLLRAQTFCQFTLWNAYNKINTTLQIAYKIPSPIIINSSKSTNFLQHRKCINHINKFFDMSSYNFPNKIIQITVIFSVPLNWNLNWIVKYVIYTVTEVKIIHRYFWVVGRYEWHNYLWDSPNFGQRPRP